MADDFVTLQAKFIDKTEAARSIILAAADEAAFAMAQNVFEESQRQVPVASGDLKKTGRIERSKPNKGSSTIRYGSAKIKYAAAVHQRPGARYRKGKWQYLRDPLLTTRKISLARAAKVYRATLARSRSLSP